MTYARLTVTAILFLILFSLTPLKAHAGMIDRVKDIYETPERIDDLQEYYKQSASILEGQMKAQQEKLEEARQQAEELLARQEALQQSNESYQKQNEALLAEKAEMLAKQEEMQKQLEQAEAKRKDTYRKGVIAVGSLIAAFIAYALSVRVWRFLVWRRQGRDERGALLP
ncbi:hypothetical protein [Paenibacillus sp. HB172176]|uniref:hypothetical protein n=1 Tax=Paenibacillus sp. HB172176 TaxID=2493690 RepID=UPI00143AC4EE|nr:hypothetical protein [Paenibacillus sp. HB172176]